MTASVRRALTRAIPALGDLLAVAFIAAIVWSGAAWLNQPVEAPPWQGQLSGLSFSPYDAGSSPLDGDEPSEARIAADLALAAGLSRSVRTYSALGALAEVPKLAESHGLKVTLGAWLGRDDARNRLEIAEAAALSRRHANVERILAGNETMLRGEIALARLVEHLRELRRLSRVPVSTSEPWHVWLANPSLADEVDFIAAHILPYWEGIPAAVAADYVLRRGDELRAAFPGKEIVLTEVGWPSDGTVRGGARPSKVNQGLFLRRFLPQAEASGLDYYVIEAFDQPWKMTLEGHTGAYWGVYDAARRSKATLDGPLIETPGWRVPTAGALVVAALLALLLMRRLRHVRLPGRALLALLVIATAQLAAWALQLHETRYLNHLSLGLLLVMGSAFLLLLVLTLTEGLELIECLWTRRWRRRFMPAAPAADLRCPKVSIHLPIRSEPPSMVMVTLEALARLDYPDFEVLVVDNNTADEALWRPVAERCRTLGPQFRFLRLGDWPGFKAGALNVALARTRPQSEIIAVLDSDYEVKPDWLRRLVPLFDDPALALVQAPQDQRDAPASLFKRLCFWEYAGFFRLGMVQRNERDAIIQHGTMVLLRRSALEAVDGWAEWCLCEDAELGLRLAAKGYGSAYVVESFGRGLLPDSFQAYRQQRFRWAYGAMQILRGHARALVAEPRSGLSLGQRYHYLAGWLPWLADGLHLAVSLFALAWTLGLILLPGSFHFPLGLFVATVLGYAGFKLAKLLWLYQARVGSGLLGALGAALAGLALSHGIAKAVWRGLAGRPWPFHRTPKAKPPPGIVTALHSVREELALLAGLWAAALGIVTARGALEPAAQLWALLLLVQSLPYLAALVMALLGAAPSLTPRGQPRLADPRP